MIKRKNIWFFCPACDKKLVVGVEGGGYRADCPECGANIPIPVRSTAYPAWVRKVLVYAAQALLVAGVLASAWWIHFRQASAVSIAQKKEPVAMAQPAVAATEIKSEASTDQDVNQDLLAAHTELEGKYNKMLQWMFDNYRGKYPIPERLVSSLRISPVDDKGQVNPDLVEMLKLTDQEKVLVQDVITYVRKSLQQKERELVQVTEQREDKITYTVPVFPDAGQMLRDDLYATMEKTLGTPRFDRMLDVTEESMREQMHYFGEASRELSFQVIKPPVEGQHPPYLIIRDGWVVPEGDSVRVTKVTETAVMKLPDSYQDYRDWLPDTMSGYATP